MSISYLQEHCKLKLITRYINYSAPIIMSWLWNLLLLTTTPWRMLLLPYHAPMETPKDHYCDYSKSKAVLYKALSPDLGCVSENLICGPIWRVSEYLGSHQLPSANYLPSVFIQFPIVKRKLWKFVYFLFFSKFLFKYHVSMYSKYNSGLQERSLKWLVK